MKGEGKEREDKGEVKKERRWKSEREKEEKGKRVKRKSSVKKKRKKERTLREKKRREIRKIDWEKGRKWMSTVKGKEHCEKERKEGRL